jgi:nucleotide-binding universal stress UspA family protein
MPQMSKQLDLVAVDSEGSSQGAVVFAVSQARYDQRPLVFVHVMETSDEHDENGNPPSIDAALLSASKAGVFAESRVMRGRAREEISAAARDVDPRFVFVGTSRPTGAERWFLGSVAADVVRHSDAPVVIVPSLAYPLVEGDPLLSRLLVPIDPNDNETSAAASAIAFAAQTKRQVIFCAVVDEERAARVAAQLDGADIIADNFRDIVASIRSRARRVISAATALAHAQGVTARGLVLTGEPVCIICKIANQDRATAIVMGTHGRQGISRFILGSTTQRVLEASEIPVVTLRLGHGLPQLDVTNSGAALPADI